MMNKVWGAILVLVLISTTSHAQKFSNEFLKIGIGARAHGMSSSMSSHTNDLTAAYWNPAGLSNIEGFQAAFMHAEWFSGISKYDYGSVAFPMKNAKNQSALSFGFIRLGVDNIPNTFNLVEPDGTINFDNITPFSAVDFAVFGSFGKKLKNPNFSIGGSSKIISRRIGTFGKSFGFGIDLGMQFDKGNGYRFGVTARDITGTFNAWNFSYTQDEKDILALTNNEIPESSTETTSPSFLIGNSYLFDFNQSKISLLSSMDLLVTTDGERNTLISGSSFAIAPSLGFEANYDELIYLRTGIGSFQKTKDIVDPNKETLEFQPTIGVGIQLGKVTIDYALTDVGNVSDALYSNVISLKLDTQKENRLKQKNVSNL